MNIDYMFKKVIIRSGQFLIDTNNIELDPDRFRILVEDTLSIYNRFSPYDEHIYIPSTAERDIPLTPNLVQSITGKSYLGSPDWVSDANPSRLFGINPYYVFKNLHPQSNPYLIEKTGLPWRYRKPIIYLPLSAEWDLHCVWRHRIVETESEKNGFEFSVPTIDPTDSDKFMKLLQGMFLQGIGRSRRAFTMNDLPILMDGADITSEGVELEKEALDDLENVQKFWLAW